jgi:hypothetical protein
MRRPCPVNEDILVLYVLALWCFGGSFAFSSFPYGCRKGAQVFAGVGAQTSAERSLVTQLVGSGRCFAAIEPSSSRVTQFLSVT